MTKKQKRDLHQEITDQMIAMIEANPKAWQSGLKGFIGSIPLRHNFERYQGINVIWLSMVASSKGYGSSIWMTYKQASDLGGQVRKGEKSTLSTFSKPVSFDDKNVPKGEEPRLVKYWLLRCYSVFNVDQIDGLPEKYYPVKPSSADEKWANIDAGELLLKSSACEVKTINQTPHYAPELDFIGIPEKSVFSTANNFYATLAHEMGHSTGHKSRLDRVLQNRDKKAYAFEELIAELSAIFTCTRLGIDGDTENHASYLKSWLRHLKDDKKFIFQASAQAQRVSDWLLARVDKLADKPIDKAA